jgi:hypothetical protein
VFVPAGMTDPSRAPVGALDRNGIGGNRHDHSRRHHRISD